jgi:hypothetical protein
LLGVSGDVDPLATQPQKALTESCAAVAEQPSPVDRPTSAQGREDDELGGRVRDLTSPRAG